MYSILFSKEGEGEARMGRRGKGEARRGGDIPVEKYFHDKIHIFSNRMCSLKERKW